MAWIDMTGKCNGIGPEARTYHTCTYVEERSELFVIGGANESELLGDIYVLSFKKGQQPSWEKWDVQLTGSRNTLTPRARHSAVHIEGKIYVFGGIGGGQSVFALDLKNRRWIRLKTVGQAPAARFAHCAVAVHEMMYIIGGHSGSRYLNDVHRFCTRSRQWGAIPVLMSPRPTPSLYYSACRVGDEVALFGGSVGKKLDHFWKLQHPDASSQAQVEGRKSSFTARHGVLRGSYVWKRIPVFPEERISADFTSRIAKSKLPAPFVSLSTHCVSMSPSMGQAALGVSNQRVYLTNGAFGDTIESSDAEGEREPPGLVLWILDIPITYGSMARTSQSTPLRWQSESLFGEFPTPCFGSTFCGVGGSGGKCKIVRIGGTISILDATRVKMSNPFAREVEDDEQASSSDDEAFQGFHSDSSSSENATEAVEGMFRDFEDELTDRLVRTDHLLIRGFDEAFEDPYDSFQVLSDLSEDENETHFVRHVEVTNEGFEPRPSIMRTQPPTLELDPVRKYFSCSVHVLDTQFSWSWMPVELNEGHIPPVFNNSLTSLCSETPGKQSFLLYGGDDGTTVCTTNIGRILESSLTDTSEKVWSIKPLPANLNLEPLSGHTATYSPAPRNTIYVFGGVDQRGNPSNTLWALQQKSNDEWLWNPVLPSREEQTRSPTKRVSIGRSSVQKTRSWPPPRASHSASMFREKLYIIGGMGDNGSLLSDTWIGALEHDGDSSTVKWINNKILRRSSTAGQTGKFRLPPVMGHSSIVVEAIGALLVFGGCVAADEVGTSALVPAGVFSSSSSLTLSNSLFELNLRPKMQQWKNLDSSCTGRVPSPRFGHECVLVGGNGCSLSSSLGICVIGGFGFPTSGCQKSALNDLFFLNIMHLTWSEPRISLLSRSVKPPTENFPDGKFPGRFRFGASTVDDNASTVIVFGGTVDQPTPIVLSSSFDEVLNESSELKVPW